MCGTVALVSTKVLHLEKMEKKKLLNTIINLLRRSHLIFVLRKKGSKTKKRMKEEEIERGDCGPPTCKSFFFFRDLRFFLRGSQFTVSFFVSQLHEQTKERNSWVPLLALFINRSVGKEVFHGFQNSFANFFVCITPSKTHSPKSNGRKQGDTQSQNIEINPKIKKPIKKKEKKQ